MADAVSRDRKQGERLELSSTPSIFINGRKFEPTGEFKEDLDDWVSLEIKLAGGTPTPHVASAAGAPSASAAPAPSGKAAVKEAKPKGTL